MNFYLPPELYENVKFTLLLVNGKCSTTPYFQQMEQSIMNSVPVASNHRNNINQGNLHHYHENTDNPFFETIVRSPMSDKMKAKINKKYDSVIAKQIFKYCGSTKTLRFTADITRSNDILAFINRPT